MSPASANQYLLFRIADQTLAFPLSVVRELLPAAAVTRPPEAPLWLHGFLRLGRETLPVVELAALLALPRSVLSLQSHFIRLAEGPIWFVDRVEQIATVPELSPLPVGHLINEYATGSFPVEAGEAVVLDPARLLLAEERERITQLATREHARREEAGKSVDA
jgi:chemotaxis signal transduction protein